MRFTVEGLVIREKNVGETDRLVTILTREMGVIRAFAAGAKNIKSKKGAATGLLSYSSFTILKKNDTYKIYEATPIRVFFGAGSDIIKLSLSQYFCELCEVTVPSDTDSEEYLRLVLNSLHFLLNDERKSNLIKAITELRLCSISGYSPNLVACEKCGKFEDDVMYFSLRFGSIYCSECKTTDYCIPINRTVLSAMRHIVFSEFKNLYSFDIPQKDAEILSSLTEKYIVTQTEHRYSTLDFYNSIL